MKFLNYGPTKSMVRTSVRIFWPVIIAGKRLSSVPILKWLIYPFFARPFNELTSVPINVKLDMPQSTALPRRILERLFADVNEKFILDECICRGHNRVDSPPRDIGCMVLGPASARMHPSHGRFVGTDAAIAHLDRAARAGLVANVAHVWIDPVAFWTRFRDLMFICFCDDANCLYRTHMKRRGPSLDRAYKRLPGITLAVDAAKCTGCGTCASACFLAAIGMRDEKAAITDACAGCGRCVEVCPEGAITLAIENEETLYRQLLARIREMSELPLKGGGGARGAEQHGGVQ
jgi:ferredoxin